MTTPLTGAILVGGDSRRMGRDKATLSWQGRTLLTHVHDLIAPLCNEILLITQRHRHPDSLGTIPVGCRVVNDKLEGRGPLVGIHAALDASRQDRVLVVACDMPWLVPRLLVAMTDDDQGDVVIPRTARGWEPLHAIYHRRCLPAIEETLALGPRPVPAFFGDVQVTIWDAERCRIHDPEGRSFRNVNSPDDLVEVIR